MMISTKIKVIMVLLVVAVSIHQSEERKFWKKPFKGLIKGIGNIGEKIGKETARGIKKVGKEVGRGFENSKDLVKDLVKKPLKELSRSSSLLVKLLGRRKKVKVQVQEKQPGAEENAPASEAFDVSMVRLHNQIRSEASSQPAVKWDKLLETAAQEWADQCSISYKVFDDSRDETYGQNIYPVKDADADPYSAVQMWASSKESYKSGTFECKENQDCYPYLQMIWSNTKYIGCAATKCPIIKDIGAAGSVLVCFYTPL